MEYVYVEIQCNLHKNFSKLSFEYQHPASEVYTERQKNPNGQCNPEKEQSLRTDNT